MDLEKAAIEQLKFGEQISLQYYKKPLLLTYSGGKDSDVCLELAKRSGIQFEVVHSHTTADAPETVRYVRKVFHELELEGVLCSVDYPTYKGQPVSMWSLIPQKLMPPTRIVRYCCSILKETSGKNRAIVTGVRKAESTKRSSRGEIEALGKRLGEQIILNNDNDTKRRFVEHCEMQGKIVVNPIIDWENRDVWSFLREARKETNPCYEKGFSRVGCIGCPMAGKGREREFSIYPKYAEMYKRAFDRMLEARKAKGKPWKWKTGEDVFRWWMEDENLDGQFDLFGGEVGVEP